MFFMGLWGSLFGKENAAIDDARREGYLAGLHQGQNDMTQWCSALQDALQDEVAASIAYEELLRRTLEDLERHDESNWLLVERNRRRVAHYIFNQVKESMPSGVCSPYRKVYTKRPDGFLVWREAGEDEPIGYSRTPNGKIERIDCATT